jgi:hypothetical protein
MSNEIQMKCDVKKFYPPTQRPRPLPVGLHFEIYYYLLYFEL